MYFCERYSVGYPAGVISRVHGVRVVVTAAACMQNAGATRRIKQVASRCDFRLLSVAAVTWRATV